MTMLPDGLIQGFSGGAPATPNAMPNSQQGNPVLQKFVGALEAIKNSGAVNGMPPPMPSAMPSASAPSAGLPSAFPAMPKPQQAVASVEPFRPQFDKGGTIEPTADDQPQSYQQPQQTQSNGVDIGQASRNFFSGLIPREGIFSTDQQGHINDFTPGQRFGAFLLNMAGGANENFGGAAKWINDQQAQRLKEQQFQRDADLRAAALMGRMADGTPTLQANEATGYIPGLGQTVAGRNQTLAEKKSPSDIFLSEAHAKLANTQAMSQDPRVQYELYLRKAIAAHDLPPDTPIPTSGLVGTLYGNSAPYALPGYGTPTGGATNGAAPAPTLPSVAGISVSGAAPTGPASAPAPAPDRASSGQGADWDAYNNKQAVIAGLPPEMREAYQRAILNADPNAYKILESAPNVKGAQAAAEEQGKEWSKAVSGARQKIEAASRMELTLGQVENILNDPHANTGATEPWRTQIANYVNSAAGANIMDPKRTGNAEAMTALMNQLVAAQAKALQSGEGGGSGASQRITDSDLRLFSSTEPALHNTPLGNRLIIALSRERLGLEKQIATATLQAQRENPGNPAKASAALDAKIEAIANGYDHKRQSIMDGLGVSAMIGRDGQPLDPLSAFRSAAKKLNLPDSVADEAFDAYRHKGKDAQAILAKMQAMRGGQPQQRVAPVAPQSQPAYAAPANGVDFSNSGMPSP